MSFAVIKTGGKQYKVKAGEILKIEKLDISKPNSKIEFNDVLAYGDNKSAELGNPKVDGAKVEADLIKNGKNRTVLVFKKRRRKNSRKKYGHRQPISLIRITKIFSKNGKLISEAGPQKQLTKEIVKGDQTRKKQILEAQKTKVEEQKKISQKLKKIEAKKESTEKSASTKTKLKEKKSDISKKKPLTTKKK